MLIVFTQSSKMLSLCFRVHCGILSEHLYAVFLLNDPVRINEPLHYTIWGNKRDMYSSASLLTNRRLSYKTIMTMS